ncbi:hypothetical protein Tco_1415363, partial [Tanacetum coccineum]
VKDATARDRAVVSENKGKGVNVVKASACWGNPQQKEYKEKGVIDNGCSRHMTRNKFYLTKYEDYDGGFVSFGDGKGRISGKEPQTAPLQTKTPPTVSHEPQIEAHIEQILPSPSTYHRKHRKTQKHRRVKKVIELPQTSVPLDLGTDEAIQKEGVTGMDIGSSPRCQETIKGAYSQTRSKRVLEKPNKPPLPEGHTFRSEEGSMEHTFELMDTIPPTPHDSPLIGGYTPDESSDNDLDEEDASKQERESDKTKSMFQDSNFDVLDDDMKDVEGETVNTATTGVSAVSAPVTTAGTLVKMRSEKAKVKGVAFKDVEETPRLTRSTTTLQPLLTIDPKDKEFDEIQARMYVDHELAIRLTHEEQEKHTIEERATLLAEYFERRNKQLATERAEAIRNKPPTRAQVKNRIITYLKHMESNEEATTDYEQEKEELRMWLAVVLDEDETVYLEILSVKYPIVDWES